MRGTVAREEAVTPWGTYGGEHNPPTFEWPLDKKVCGKTKPPHWPTRIQVKWCYLHIYSNSNKNLRVVYNIVHTPFNAPMN